MTCGVLNDPLFNYLFAAFHISNYLIVISLVNVLSVSWSEYMKIVFHEKF